MARSNNDHTSVAFGYQDIDDDRRTTIERDSHSLLRKNTLCNTISKSTQNKSAQSLNPMLEELLQADHELRTWLELTGYFDLENRKRALDRAKSWKEFEQKRAEFLAQVQLADAHTSRTGQQELPALLRGRSVRASRSTPQIENAAMEGRYSHDKVDG